MKNRIRPEIVLVSDRTLSGDYKILFEGIFATMQMTHVPELAMRYLLSPEVKTDRFGRAQKAVLGLRRVEAALIKYAGFSEDQVLCTTPEKLDTVLGPWVKVVCVSSSDPLGNGMSNTTTKSFWKGQLYCSFWMRSMLEKIAVAKDKYGFKVLAGGAGAWQWNRYSRHKCIDVVFDGYFEKQGPAIVKALADGTETPGSVVETGVCADLICPIRRASVLGIVELSRGCGRGCRFCSMAAKKMEHLSSDIILSDIETNISAGISSVVSGSEDFFRYGAQGLKPDFTKLASLLEQMQKLDGLDFMQVDHGNITSVLQFADTELKEIRRLLSWKKKTDYLWVNMGVESANGQLVKNICPGKISPFVAEDWEDMVIQAAEKMHRCGFFGVYSIVLGLDGETAEDVNRTLGLVKKLEKYGAVIFPIFYEPVRADEIAGGKGFNTHKMTARHLELYSYCYEINFRRVPELFWDNQRAGGVSFAKRALLRLLGKYEVHLWRSAFKKLAGQLTG